jgi:hypothetical protein
MNLSEEVDLEDYVARPDKVNNAEIAAICQVGGRGAPRHPPHVPPPGPRRPRLTVQMCDRPDANRAVCV